MFAKLDLALEALRRDGPTSLLRQVARYPRSKRDVRSAIAEFRRASDQVQSVPEAVDLAFEFQAGPVTLPPLQVRSEITALVERVSSLAPQTLLQIGTATGGTLFLLTRFASPDAVVVTVDLPHGPLGRGYTGWMEDLYNSFARDRQRVELVLGDSHGQAIHRRTARALGGRELDFLFIDGDHSYEGVSRDWEMYSPLVRSGGHVAFHDIVPGPLDRVGGVPRFWREVKGQGSQATEFVESWDQGRCGIGLLRKH
jgi:predicted O-methyltransferase YrrM